MSRRWWLLGGVVAILLAMSVGYNSYLNSFQTIKVNSAQPFRLKVYQSLHGESGFTYDSDHPMLELSKTGDYRLKKGLYVYVASGGTDYQSLTRQVKLGSVPVTIDVTLELSDKKLVSLLLAEEPAIKSVIQERYPSQLQSYTIQKSRLYKDGGWYAAKLVPNDTSTNDTLGIVLKKTGVTWRIVTLPPEIVISKAIYPEIPSEVLTDLNNFR